jgi:hypothetical protein
MSSCNKLSILASALVLLITPLFASAVEAKTRSKVQHRHFVNKSNGCPVRQLADGSLVDCQGWRKWSGSIGWDNSCVNLDYLPSEFACSRGRR